jgi:hypothetical protein
VLRLTGALIAVTGVLLSAFGAAGAATPQRAEFRVSLTGTLTKDWTHARLVAGDCVRVTTHTGHWKLSLATRRPSRIVVARAASPAGALRLSRATVTSIAGQASQSGFRRSEIRGGQRCIREFQRTTCAGQRRSFRGGTVKLTSPARGRARFAPLRGASAVRSFRGSCPEEPADIRAIRTDLALADAPLTAADAFDRTVPRFFISGNSEQVTTISGPYTGRVTERVRWTLTFTRVS